MSILEAIYSKNCLGMFYQLTYAFLQNCLKECVCIIYGRIKYNFMNKKYQVLVVVSFGCIYKKKRKKKRKKERKKLKYFIPYFEK